MRVLIVDDEIDICSLVCSIFHQSGIKCDSVHNMNDARRNIKSHNYDLFLLDIKLPDGNGFDLIEDIRGLASDPEVVMISALDDEIEHNKARSLGVKKFISKPFTKKEIISIL